jgi:putative transposase
MSWHETNVYREKYLFIADWLKQEFSMTELCKRYGVSRKTGYKFLNKYIEDGEGAFKEKSSARHTHPNKTPEEIQAKILDLKYRYLHWGPAKLRDWFHINEPKFTCPAASTVGEILKKHGLVKNKKCRKKVAKHAEPLAHCDAPNRVWSADFKGHFRLLLTKAYCYPLTISDNFSRFLLHCEGLEKNNYKLTKQGFEKVFFNYGLPDSMRTDNGQPFAGLGIGGLTKLSIWFLKLGIMPERIEPGCPEQNGRHERMHRTLKEATAKPPQKNMGEQQKCFTNFMQEYNYERPHQALNGKRPSDVYSASVKSLPSKLPEIYYPKDFLIRKVKTNGEIKWHGKRYFVSELLHKEPVGLEIIDDGRAFLYFSKLKLGIIDARNDKIIRP